MGRRIQRRLQQWRNCMNSWACHPHMLRMRKRVTTSSARISSRYHVECPISYSSNLWKRYTNENVKWLALYNHLIV